MITATGIVSVIIQVFVVDKVVRRFGEANVLRIFSRCSSIWLPSVYSSF